MRFFILLALAVSTVTFAQASQPNIIFILADDLGYSDIGAYGGEIDTPNLDALAAGGAHLQSFYNMGRCSPSRAALLTGRYPHEVGMGHLPLRFDAPGYRGVLDHAAPTLPEMLRGAGYRSYMVGKWHLTTHKAVSNDQITDEALASWPLARGFDRFYGTIQGAGSYYDPVDLVEDDRLISAPDGFYYTDAMTDKAIAYLNQHQQEHIAQPFFFYIAYTAPHWPLHAKAEDIAKYRPRYQAGWDDLRAARLMRMKQLGLVPDATDLSDRPQNVPAFAQAENKDWEIERMATYAAMVDNMDQNVGHLLRALEANGLRDNTLILFMSDNGASTEEPGGATANPLVRKLMAAAGLSTTPLQTRDGSPIRSGADPQVMPGPETSYMGYGPAWANLSNTPFRLHKQFTHEGGIKSPLIANWPARIKPQNAPLSTRGHIVDIAATALDAAKLLPTDVTLRGRSLLPALSQTEPMAATLAPPTLYFEHQGNRAVINGDIKLVARGTNEWELYDLSTDPAEANDLSAAQNGQSQIMSDAWSQWANSAQVEPWSGTMLLSLLPTTFKLVAIATVFVLLLLMFLGTRRLVRALK